jgi:putative membrane protein
MAQETAGKPTAPPDQLTLALERTLLAHERTLMAWIRTGLSLTTFGFTLYKFFEFLHEHEPGRFEPQALGARTFGRVMIAIGIVTLALATWQHRQSMNVLRAHYPGAPRSLSLLLAVVISALGILALIATVPRG